MNATFSKGQRVHGEYRGQFYKGVITNVTARDTDMVISVKLDSEISVKGEFMPRDKFMTAVSADGDFTASAYTGYMALVSEDVQPTDEPAEVDMGGDFEGFIVEVNAGQEASFTPETWYAIPVVSVGGEKIQARGTKQLDGSYIVEVLANGMALEGYSATAYGRLIAQAKARELVRDCVTELNRQRAIEMGDETETPASNYPTPESDDANPWDYDEDEARVKKHDRIAEIRRQLERLDRERDSLAFELAQLVGE